MKMSALSKRFSLARDAATEHRLPACEGKRASSLLCANSVARLRAGGTPACHYRRDACLPSAHGARSVQC